MSSPAKPAEFFPFAVHIIYAIVLTSSFEIASDVFVPLENIAISPEHVANALAVFVVYFILIAGWLSYALAIIHEPHKPNEMGVLRFGIDLVIMTLLFYLVSLSDTEKFYQSFWHVFVWLLPLLFHVYVVWDTVEFYEYRGAGKRVERKIVSQMVKSTIGFGLMGLQAIAFVIADIFFGYTELYIAFSITTLAITAYYRINSWNIARLKPGSVRNRSDIE